MVNEERILATADVQFKMKRVWEILCILIPILSAVSLGVGLWQGSGYESEHSVGDWVSLRWYGWFAIYFYIRLSLSTYNWYTDKYDFESDTSYYTGNIIWVGVLHLSLICLPILLPILARRKSKNTSLVVTESQIYGTYVSDWSIKELKMPLEKVDSLSTVSNIFSKCYYGTTLVVHSASGVFKIPFVQNAEEVVAAAMEQIEELKAREDLMNVTEQSAVAMYDNLKVLAQMKEEGIITEEEFQTKKKHLLQI